HFLAARLAVRRVAPIHHRAQVRILVDVLVLFEHAVDPARNRHAGLFHHRLRGVAAFDPLVVDAPNTGAVLPGSGRDALLTGPRGGARADVGGTLHGVVAAGDVRAAARHPDIAKPELEDAGGAHEGVPDAVLRLPHAPHDRGGPVFGPHLGDLVPASLGTAAD